MPVTTPTGYTPTRAQDLVTKIYVDTRANTLTARTTFAGRPNGSWTVQDTGQTVGNTGASLLTIVSGVLTHTNTASQVAGYSETTIGQRVGRIGATFQIPNIALSGTITVVVPSASWVSGGVGSATAGCHLYVTATDWAYQVYDGSALTTVLSGTHALTANTDYDIEVVFDGSTTARVFLPDGSVVTVTHALIGSAVTTYGLFELFEGSASTVPLKISTARIDGIRNAPLNATTVAKAVASKANTIAGAVPVFIQQTQPTGVTIFEWYQTNANGDIVGHWLYP